MIAEARKFDHQLKQAKKYCANMAEYGYAQDRFCDGVSKILSDLCDALEQAQFDTYMNKMLYDEICAENSRLRSQLTEQDKEIERLREAHKKEAVVTGEYAQRAIDLESENASLRSQLADVRAERGKELGEYGG